MSEEAGAPQHGKIGEQIFEQVERLVSAEKLTRTQAFQRISDETGRRPGTVAANYYRIARLRGAPLKRRRPRAGRGGASGQTDGAAALASAQEALAELAGVVKRQDAELTRLREHSVQLDRLKRWMDKNM